MDDKDDKQHFNMKQILDNEKRKKKKKRSKKENTHQTVDDNFEIDVQDRRFNALFNSADYSLDPSDPQFKYVSECSCSIFCFLSMSLFFYSFDEL